MQNNSSIDQDEEYSDDNIAFHPISQSDLDDIEDFDLQMSESPKKDMEKLGNPMRQNDDEQRNYSMDYYYSNKYDKETFHIFRTKKSFESEERRPNYFPSVKYIKSIQEIQGISLLKIVDFNESKKWVQFEYVPGGTLYESIYYGKKYTIADMYRMIARIADTISSLHQSGINHLDIRLENIIISHPDEIPVLADTDMVIHQYKNREDYDDRYLIYLDPLFESIEKDSTRHDIYMFGVVIYLLVTKNIKILEKSNYQNIKDAFSEFKKSEDKYKFEKYLNKIGIVFKESDDYAINKLLELSRDCLIGRFNDLLESILSERYFDSILTNNVQELRENNLIKSCKNTFEDVLSSASKFNSIDVWLVNKRNKICDKKAFLTRAADASFYGAITGDFNIYQQILFEEF